MSNPLLTEIDITNKDVILIVDNQPVLEVWQVNDNQAITLFLYPHGGKCSLQCDSVSVANIKIIVDRTIKLEG